MQSDTDSRMLPRSLACSRACMVRTMESGTDNPMEDKLRCMQGFSHVQINILGILKSHTEVLAYWQIAHLLEQHYGGSVTEGSVRGALERLFPREFLVRRRASRGRLKGNRYALATDPCTHIQPCNFIVGVVTESDTQSAGTAAPSILEKADRKILSVSSQEAEESKAVRLLEALTEEDMHFHWPALARQGFGTDQIRQIISRLVQVNISVKQIMQGLTYAEWELAADRMRDKSGTPVTSPVSWVFKILATQGYYPRPEGYRSPQEQAELDAVEELRQRTAAYEARQAAEGDAWIARLTPDERSAILGPQSNIMRMPDEVVLRCHFRSEIWPLMQREERI